MCGKIESVAVQKKHWTLAALHHMDGMQLCIDSTSISDTCLHAKERLDPKNIKCGPGNHALLAGHEFFLQTPHASPSLSFNTPDLPHPILLVCQQTCHLVKVDRHATASPC